MHADPLAKNTTTDLHKHGKNHPLIFAFIPAKSKIIATIYSKNMNVSAFEYLSKDFQYKPGQ